MPKLLGIDYGTQIIGVSLAVSYLAEPLIILDNSPTVFTQIQRLCQQEGIEKIIVGVSENDMAIKSKAFGEQLRQTINIPVEYHDETLSSYEAKKRLQHAKKSIRNEPQDAYQATVMLQDYLDTQVDRSLNKV